MPNLQLLPGTLANPACYPESPQAFYNEMFELGVAVAPTTAGVVGPQDAEPSAEDRDKVWIRTSGGAPVIPLGWIFHNGQWVAKHPIAASSSFIWLYEGTAGSIDTLDGGAAGAVSVNSGPFWEIVTSMQTRVPVGVGTLPSGTTLAVGDLGGEEDHILTQAELPLSLSALTANLTGFRTNMEAAPPIWLASPGSGPQTATTPPSEEATFTFTNTGGGQGHNTLPLYRAVYFLRRTARQLCTQPIA